MNILLYSLQLRAELLMKAYQKAYQKMLEKSQEYETMMTSEMPEILEYS